jgi:hypothetical protein
MHLNELIRRMVELEEAVEEGERAAALLDECRSIAEQVMGRDRYYRVKVGTFSQIERIYRLARDCDLKAVYGPLDGRPIVDASDVLVDPDLLAGSRAFPRPDPPKADQQETLP